MFAYKGSFGLDWIIPIGSLAVIPFSCSEKYLRNTWHQQRLRAEFKQLIFFDGQNHNEGIDAIV